MRVVYICRVFSGFETSLASRVWRPTGAPTIYRMIEALDRSPHDVHFIMPCKGVGAEFRTDWIETNDVDVILEGLNRPVTVLASEHRYPSWLGRLRGPLTSLRHLWRLWRTVDTVRPDLIYVDRSNVLAGALFARLTRVPVVLRVMGVYPSMWDTLRASGLAAGVTRWAYRAPFALVICTQDGSGGERWLPEALAENVSHQMLLNGFDGNLRSNHIDPKLHAIPKDRTIVLFVGRFESIKGCEEFANAIISIHRSGRRDIHAVMIGAGLLHDKVRGSVAAAGASDSFTFIERLSHDQIPEAHKRADIYVSLNKLGQLSNANLEAMSMGGCMIVPQAQPERGVDIATEALIDADAVVRLPWKDQSDALAGVLAALVDDPARRAAMKARMAEVAARLIRTWDERIAEEFGLIAQYAGTRI